MAPVQSPLVRPRAGLAVALLSATAALTSLLVLGGAGCSGDVLGPNYDLAGTDRCVAGENRAPVAPVVMQPVPDRLDLLPDAVSIDLSAFSDPDGGATHTETQVEIWRMAGGRKALRVWSADLIDPGKLTSMTLADGTFDVGTQLDAWADYGVRARYSDGAACSAWSSWSGMRIFRTDDGSTAWFDPHAIHEVRINIDQASHDALDAQAVPPGCVPFIRQYYPGSVTIDGQSYDDVGVRTKGGCGSARHLTGKASWKINLSWDDPNVAGCPDEHRIDGLKRFTLNNQVQDHSFVHEMLAYRFYRLMGVPTPRANHALVYVNDQLWGVYLNIDSFDRRFLSRWFASDQGALYEGTYYCDLLAQNIPPGDGDDTNYCISTKFHPSACSPTDPGADPEDFTAIRTLADQLAALPDGGFYPAIEQYFDFDTYLSMWAADEILGNWDGYTIQTVNNYRVYHDPGTGRWTIVPSGVDQTFQQQTPLDAGHLMGMLAQRCWNEPACQEAFEARLRQAVSVFEQANLGALASDIHDTIAADVMADPRKEGTYDEFESGVAATIAFIQNRPAQIRAELGGQ